MSAASCFLGCCASVERRGRREREGGRTRERGLGGRGSPVVKQQLQKREEKKGEKKRAEGKERGGGSSEAFHVASEKKQLCC